MYFPFRKLQLSLLLSHSLGRNFIPPVSAVKVAPKYYIKIFSFGIVCCEYKREIYLFRGMSYSLQNTSGSLLMDHNTQTAGNDHIARTSIANCSSLFVSHIMKSESIRN